MVFVPKPTPCPLSLPSSVSVVTHALRICGGADAPLAWLRSVLGLQVSHEARRSILVDVLTVHAAGGKSIVFCDRKRDADEVAAGVALAMPCEVLSPTSLG